MAKDSYAEKERLLKLKHHLELEKLAARREKARLSTTGILGQMIVNLGPDPLDVEAAELKEKQNNELIALVEERMASAGHVPKGETQSALESTRENVKIFTPESIVSQSTNETMLPKRLKQNKVAIVKDMRRLLVDKFIARVFDSTGRKITRKNIWTAAGYKEATDFERFQRNDKRTTKAAMATFTRILSMEPEVFERILDKKQPAK
jgi:hypothetical protein